ncbi:MAG: hypothetical protein NXI00_24400, partial [Cytophagales bacterium]|nr:hypothetical protein [Cytophagales bacterium]
MKRLNFVTFNLALLLLTYLISCSSRPEPDYYKNLFTGEILDKGEFEQFRDSLIALEFDTIEGEKMFITHFKELITSNDSIIQHFNYSIRVGMEYLVREPSYEKLGMAIPKRTFSTIDGDSIRIGGEQAKPTLINLWFVGCTGCVQEMPELNEIKAK